MSQFQENTASVSSGDGVELRRDFNLWNAFALGFAFISPIAALYIIIGPGLGSVGGGFWWGFPITLVGQTFVVISYAQIAAHWPFEGTSYQWSKRLVGPSYGFLHGWIYAMAMAVAISTVAYQSGRFTLILFGLDASSTSLTIILALIYIGLVTLANAIGRAVLKIFITVCLWTEVIGSLGLGTILLIFYRKQDFGVVFDGLEFTGWSELMSAPIILAALFAAWGLVGMDGAASIAEEVKDPSRNVPRAMIASVVAVGVTIAYAALAIILAVPSFDEVPKGDTGTDSPITWILGYYWPSWLVKLFIVIFLTAFVTCMLTIQTVASRIVWAYARDGDLPASTWLKRLTPTTKMPRNAILVIGFIASLTYIFSGSNIYVLLITLATGGYYICFILPIIGVFVGRFRKTWPPEGQRHDGILLVVNCISFVWLAFMIVVLLWPRPVADEPWYLTWGTFVSITVVVIAGVATRILTQRRRTSVETQ